MWTIPTERTLYVGEVSTNYCGQRGVAWLVMPPAPHGCETALCRLLHTATREKSLSPAPHCNEREISVACSTLQRERTLCRLLHTATRENSLSPAPHCNERELSVTCSTLQRPRTLCRLLHTATRENSLSPAPHCNERRAIT
jgi:hypothetical protein